nr:type 1 fimbria chaperone FimC [Chania multitudinisentens]
MKSGMVILFYLLTTAFMAQAAGIALHATRVIYPAGAKQTSLSLSNSDTKGRYLINAWVDNGSEQKEKGFIITPPLFVSEANSENTLRIIYAGPPLPADRESVFWLNVKAIPAVEKASIEGKNVLQLAILSRIKLFVRPGNLPQPPENAPAQLRFKRTGMQLNITNPSPYYVSLVNLKLGTQKLPNIMAAPKETTPVPVPAAIEGNISFQTVNDYGALTPVQQGVMQ